MTSALPGAEMKVSDHKVGGISLKEREFLRKKKNISTLVFRRAAL